MAICVLLSLLTFFGAHQKIRSTGVALLLHYAARGE